MKKIVKSYIDHKYSIEDFHLQNIKQVCKQYNYENMMRMKIKNKDNQYKILISYSSYMLID
jgi:hypothetical protein